MANSTATLPATLLGLERWLKPIQELRAAGLEQLKRQIDSCSAALEQSSRFGIKPVRQAAAWTDDSAVELQEQIGEVGRQATRICQFDQQIANTSSEIVRLENELANLFYLFMEWLLKGTRKERIEGFRQHLTQLSEERKRSLNEMQQLANHIQSAKNALFDQLPRTLVEFQTRFAEVFDSLSPPQIAGWSSQLWESWTPTAQPESTLRAGMYVEQVRVVVERVFGKGLADVDLSSVPSVESPAYLPFIGQSKSIVLHFNQKTKAEALSLFQSLLLRIATLLPHQSLFTLLDPAGHGAAFPMRRFLPHVSDSHDDVNIDLRELVSRIRHVTLNVLAYEEGFHLLPETTLASEPFECIFAAGFPRGFDHRAIETLLNIGNTGARAGRYLFLLLDDDQPLPRDISLDSLENAVHLDCRGRGIEPRTDCVFVPDAAPGGESQRQLLQRLESAKPRDHAIQWADVVDLPESVWWNETASSIARSPVGGDEGSLRIWFGVNEEGRPCAHGMLAAMTGQGKSNLYHALILGLATRYSPEELHLYLIDGKDGVEFKVYDNLPHARVVSLKSSAELSRSVLKELGEEKERRNSLFAACDVTSFTAYRQAGSPSGPMARIVLLIDEYQELFDGDDLGSASQYLLDIAEQGRSAGIHMLLGSQRFGAPGMLSQAAIFGNVHLRIAMGMTQEDVQALTALGPAGKDLVRQCDMPGKVVINDQTGEDGGNAYGKVAKMPGEADFIPRRIERFRELAVKTGINGRLAPTVVFNGRNQPRFTENSLLRRVLSNSVRGRPDQREQLARRPAAEGGFDQPGWVASDRPLGMWLGQQFNVWGHAMLTLQCGVGQHAAVLGSDSAARQGILTAMLISLTALYSPDELSVDILDRGIKNAPGGMLLEQAANELLLPLSFNVRYSRASEELEPLLERLTSLLDERSASDDGDWHPVLVMLNEVERNAGLRADPSGFDESPTVLTFQRLVAEGPRHGIHLVLGSSALRSLSQVVAPRDLAQFSHRVAMQMSEDDSFTFMQSRRASMLQRNGPRPVVGLYYDLDSGQADNTFKPYDWNVWESDLATMFDAVSNGLKGKDGS